MRKMLVLALLILGLSVVAGSALAENGGILPMSTCSSNFNR
jgi:hypothetical protein